MADEELDKGTDAAATKDEAQKAWDEPRTQADDNGTKVAQDDAGVTEEKNTGVASDEAVATEAEEAEALEESNESDDDEKVDGTDKSDTDDKAGDDEDLDLPMDKIEALLSADGTDKKSMSPQLRRVAQRQAENSKRVEETIKGTKANPSWFVPLFCFLMILGLAWAVVYYLTSKYPIPGIGAWNLLIAFCIVMVGFIMTMWWR